MDNVVKGDGSNGFLKMLIHLFMNQAKPALKVNIWSKVTSRILTWLLNGTDDVPLI